MRRILCLLLSGIAFACQSDKGETSSVADTSIQDDDTYTDNDHDGFTSEDDCNDADATINPASLEICDGIDNNCNDQIDEEVTSTYYRDADEDGFGNESIYEETCSAPEGYVPNGNDCDDSTAEAFPGNVEICDDIDNDCDGEVDQGATLPFYADSDGDGYGDGDNISWACEAPVGYVEDDTDCDDSAAAAFPGNPEVCDEIDNDCNGDIDEDVTTVYYADTDGDNYGDASVTQNACDQPTGYSDNSEDCDDTDPDTYPGAIEYCDGHDDDCDGDIDEADAFDALDWFADADGDGFGSASTSIHQCDQPTGYVEDSTDCDDSYDDTYPGADEYCDERDNDCDGDVDEDDAVDAITWYADSDEDGYGNPATSQTQCEEPSGYVDDDTDCDDSYDDTFPGADEYCDERDNDCDGDIDEDGEVLDGDLYYYDADGDDLGVDDDTLTACDTPAGYVDNFYDCDDGDATEPVVVDNSLGSSSGSGTMSSPLDSIQDAVDRAYQCVIVFAGTYEENVELDGSSIDIWGVEGSEYTTIDPRGGRCEGSDPEGCLPTLSIASGSGSTPSVHGFTITGGTGNISSSSTTTTCADSSASYSGTTECTVTVYDYCGGGVYVDGDDPILEDLIIRDNLLPEFEQYVVNCTGGSACDFEQYWLYSYGGGICLKNSLAEINNVDLIDNYADQGGGLYVADGSISTISQSEVVENQAEDGAGLNVNDASLSGSNLIVAFNDADTDGGGLFLTNGGSTSLVNISAAYNSSASGSTRGDSLYVSSGTSLTLRNSIIYGDSGNYLAYSDGSWFSEYCNFYNVDSTGGTLGGSTAATGTGDISSDPSWTSITDDGNPYNDDWSLLSSSPSVDSGDSSSAYDDTDGTTNDMGAFGGPGGDW